MGVDFEKCESCGECRYEGAGSQCRRCYGFVCEGCLDDCVISENRHVYECSKCSDDKITDEQCRVMLEYALEHPVKMGCTVQELREIVRQETGKLKRRDYESDKSSSEEEEEEDDDDEDEEEEEKPLKRQKVHDSTDEAKEKNEF